jgi:nucleotide-binding universal stress UspA family protein
MNVHTILVPHDFSAHADRALEVAVDFARRFEAKLVLLHAYRVQTDIVIPGDLFKQVERVASEQIEETARGVASGGISIETRLTQQHPAHAIPEIAREVGADLIVMGTRGLTSWRHALMGSVAEYTVRTASCPVLTVRGEPEKESHDGRC